MNRSIVKKNVLAEVDKAPLVQLKINPECLELLNDIKLYYRFKSLNELVSTILSGNDLSKTTSTLDTSIIDNRLGSNLTQAMNIFNTFLDKAVIEGNAASIADFEKLKKTISVSDEFECKAKFRKIIEDIPVSIERLLRKNVSTTDDNSPMVVSFKARLTSLDIHENSPSKKNIWIRLDNKTYRRFFKRQESSVDPFNRRALWIALRENSRFVKKEISPKILGLVKSTHDEINDCNKAMNELISKKGNTGIYETYKTYAKALVTLNKLIIEV